MRLLGAGKTTIIREILRSQGDKFNLCISHTTRAPRDNEKAGEDYHFIDEEAFLDMQSRGEFIESMQLNDIWYGTSFLAVSKATASGKIAVFDMSTNGLKSMRDKWPTRPTPVCMFVKPPSLEVLRERLEKRATESAKVIEFRMEQAKYQLEYFDSMEGQGLFDFFVVNDNNMDSTMDQFTEGLMSPRNGACPTGSTQPAAPLRQGFVGRPDHCRSAGGNTRARARVWVGGWVCLRMCTRSPLNTYTLVRVRPSVCMHLHLHLHLHSCSD